MKTENTKEKSTPKYRDSLIKSLVKDDKVALEVANALLNKNYPHAKALDLENLLTRYYGDAVIEAGDEILVIIEQQSTINNNMPLWNPGKLKLSDAFKIHSEEITLELFVNVININYEKNHEVLEQSESLKGYSYLVSLIRTYQEELTRDESIVRAVNKCIEEGILKEYLEEKLKEVINMLVYEYDEKELYGEARYDEGIEEGEAIGAEKVLYFINQGYTPEKAVEMAKKR